MSRHLFSGAPLGARDGSGSSDFFGNLPLRGGKAQTWEGGFREPGMARWPGKITPGSASHAIVSTMDIHPTLLTLAGVPLPTDRPIDGLDLSPVLFRDRSLEIAADRLDKDEGHPCYFMYRAAAASNASEELYGVRCADHKAYWKTWGVAPPEGSSCVRPTVNKPHGATSAAYVCDPPMVFNLVEDPGENEPLAPSSAEYVAALHTIEAAKTAHLATLEPVPDQNGRGSDVQYALCADPDSKSKPATAKWPKCTSNPENWHPAEICSSAECLKANPSFKASCEMDGAA